MDEETRDNGPEVHQVGMALDAQSVDELMERIEVLKAEIGRLEEEILKKDATRSSAESVFKL